MLTALESKTPFAAVEAFPITLSPERHRQLAALACQKLSMTDYRHLDLPVVVGRLTEEAQERFVTDERLGYFASRGKSMMVNLGSPQANGLAERLLREQLITVRESDSVSFKDAAGQTLDHHQLNAYATARLNAKIMAQKPIVASILRFDAETFGASPAKVMLDFHQDRPGPNNVLSAGWHRDDAISARYAARLMRVYLLRSTAPTEFLRDSQALRDDGRTALSLGNLARLHETSMAEQVAWMTQVKAAGLIFQPKPYELTLVSANHTWHRSHRPEQPVNSSFMRLAIQAQV